MARLGTAGGQANLRVLITNTNLVSRSGSELYALEVAAELLRRGHTPIVYSPRLGPLAQQFRIHTIPISDDLRTIGSAPDLIHAQHHLECMTALTYFPEAPIVYFCHGLLPWQEMPPRHPRILHYVAINNAIRDHLLYERGIPADRITTILNFVDLEKFKPRSALPPRPKRAVMFSNYAAEQEIARTIREGCSRHGVTLDLVGLTNGNPSEHPEALLGQYDIVFAIGRSALEALAVGCAVVCCSNERLGGMVTTRNWEWMRGNNFGLRALNKPLTADHVSEEISFYDTSDAGDVMSTVRSSAGLIAAVDRIEEVYAVTLASWAQMDRSRASEGHAVSEYLRWLSFKIPEQLAENARLVEVERARGDLDQRLVQREARLADVERERDALRRQLVAINHTVTWRIHGRVGGNPLVKFLYGTMVALGTRLRRLFSH